MKNIKIFLKKGKKKTSPYHRDRTKNPSEKEKEKTVE